MSTIARSHGSSFSCPRSRREATPGPIHTIGGSSKTTMEKRSAPMRGGRWSASSGVSGFARLQQAALLAGSGDRRLGCLYRQPAAAGQADADRPVERRRLSVRGGAGGGRAGRRRQHQWPGKPPRRGVSLLQPGAGDRISGRSAPADLRLGRQRKHLHRHLEPSILRFPPS